MSSQPSLDTETENEINLMAEDGVNHAFIAQQLSVSRETVSKCIQIKKDLEEPTLQTPQNNSKQVVSLRDHLERKRRSMKRERDNSESEKLPMTKKGPGVSDIPRKTQRKQTAKIKIEKLRKKFNINHCVKVTLERLSQNQINHFCSSPVFYPSDNRRKRTTQNKAYCRKKTRVDVGVKNQKVPNSIEVPEAKIQLETKFQGKSIEIYQSEKNKGPLDKTTLSTGILDKSNIMIKPGFSVDTEITLQNQAKEKIQQPEVLEEGIPESLVLTEISENGTKHMPNKQTVTKQVLQDQSKENSQEKVPPTEKSSQGQNIMEVCSKRRILETTQEQNLIEKIPHNQNTITDTIQIENSGQGTLESKSEQTKNKTSKTFFNQTTVKKESYKPTIVQETHQEDESALRKDLKSQNPPKQKKMKESLSRFEDSSKIINCHTNNPLKANNSLTASSKSSLKDEVEAKSVESPVKKDIEYPVKEEHFCKEGSINFANSIPKYALLDIEKLKLGFKNLVCSKCYKCVDVKFPSTIEISDMEFQLQCPSCNHLKYFKRSQSSVDELNANSIGHDSFYMRLIFSSLDYGGGYQQMESMCMALGIPYIDLKSYKKYSNFIIQESRGKLEGLLKKAGETVHKVYIEDGVQFDEEGVRNINVIYDGTWIRGGRHFRYGLVVVVDVMTGLVLDYHLMSKFCFKCILAKKRRPQTFETWRTKHRELDQCRINYQSSPQDMEINGALILSQRSMQKHKFRYNNISLHEEKTCDGLNLVVQNVLSNGKEVETHWDKEQNTNNSCTQKDESSMNDEPCSIEHFVPDKFDDRQAAPNSVINSKATNDSSQTINSLSHLPVVAENTFPQMKDHNGIEHAQSTVQVTHDSSNNVSNSSQIHENPVSQITTNNCKDVKLLDKKEGKDCSSFKKDESYCDLDKVSQAKKETFPFPTQNQITKGDATNYDLKPEEKQISIDCSLLKQSDSSKFINSGQNSQTNLEMLNSSPMDIEDINDGTQVKITNLQSCKDIELEPTLTPIIIQHIPEELPKVFEQPSLEKMLDKKQNCCLKEGEVVLSPKLCKEETSVKTAEILLEIQNLVSDAREDETNKPGNFIHSDLTPAVELKQESINHSFHQTNLESPSLLVTIMENEKEKPGYHTGCNKSTLGSLSDIVKGETNHQIEEVKTTEILNKSLKQTATNLDQIKHHQTEELEPLKTQNKNKESEPTETQNENNESDPTETQNEDKKSQPLETQKENKESESMETQNKNEESELMETQNENKESELIGTLNENVESQPMETQNENNNLPSANSDEINKHASQESKPTEPQNENHTLPIIDLNLINNPKIQESKPMETQTKIHKESTIKLDLMSNLVPKDSILTQSKAGHNWADPMNLTQESKTTSTTKIEVVADKDELCGKESLVKDQNSRHLGSNNANSVIINQMHLIKKALKEIKCETLRSTMWRKCNQTKKSVPWECVEFACYYAIITHNVAIQNFIKTNHF